MRAPLAFAPPDAATHFRLMVFGAVLHLTEQHPDACATLPFLDSYRAEIARLAGRDAPPSAAEWDVALEPIDDETLPFQRLAQAGFAPLARQLLAVLAMIEEDPALALLIEREGGLPTVGGLVAAWRASPAGDRAAAVRDALRDLESAGLIETVDPTALRGERRVRLGGPLLDVLGGGVPRIEGARFEPCATLPPPERWIAPRPDTADPLRLGALVARDPAQLLLVRGPGRNGRRMLLRAIARAARLNVLIIPPALLTDPAGWRCAAATAYLARAMLIAAVEPAPGETLTIPAHPLFVGPIGIAIGASGTIRHEGAAPTLAIDLPLPDRDARARQWHACGLGALDEQLTTVSMTLGNIARAARATTAAAELASRPAAPTRTDVARASRALRDARLDALATQIDRFGDPEPLVLDPREQQEFEALLLRARHREGLAQTLGQGRGLRAMFAGASGTGKTLAARHIAARLDKDLYRVDLAATVSKYIGETEKCLDRALSAAEELDVVLLLDEGDALMGRRTDIGSSNDRYANLETNFLLQRIETFEGIIVVTTNDAERVDPAFSRRLDAMLTFRAPDAPLRREILERQLGAHSASAWLLDDIACRCALTGGQLRNVALHARLLAMEQDGGPNDAGLRSAIEREYRKTGAFSPLKPFLAAAR